jgi:hypothetical protein
MWLGYNSPAGNISQLVLFIALLDAERLSACWKLYGLV